MDPAPSRGMEREAVRHRPAGHSSVDDLVAGALGGDEACFRTLFDTTYRELRLYVGMRAASEELVDEVSQSAYVIAFESLARFSQGGSFIAWLKGIARNCLRQEVGRRARQVPIAGLDQAPARESAIDDLAQRLDHCLQRLSQTGRQLLELRYQRRLPVQEIARMLGRSASSVSVSLFRIRKTLADCLGHEVMAHV